MSDDQDVGRLDVLLGILSACGRLGDDEELFRVLAARAHWLIGFERLTVLLCDHDDPRQIVRTVLIRDGVARQVSAGEIHPSDADVIRHVLATGTPSIGIAGMASPMELAGRVVGALCFAASREPYTRQDARFAHFLAEFLAGTLDRLTRGSAMARQARALTWALGEREAAFEAADARSRHMSHLARHDVLTNLPNRLLLNDRLTRAIALAVRYKRRLAVLFLDLDRFKHINDSLGHGVGDQVLRSVADRIAATVRSSDTVSRHGGDEFVVLLAELEHADDAAISATKIIAAVTGPLHVAGHEIHLAISVGISVYPDDGESAETLTRSADIAMYHAKAQGRDGFQFFKAEMNVGIVEREFVEQDLRRALVRQEFVLHYQPMVELETGAVVGAEALIRWRHPDRGVVPPTQFVRIAEECGLMVPIGQWVLREACRQAQAWRDAGLPPIRVSVNISTIEFQRKTFVEDVDRILKETRLEARYLELELTEKVLMAHAESNIATLQRLKTMGVQLSIDDFGTGYSSLSYLTQLPIDALKVDQSFVHELSPDQNGSSTVGAALIVGAVIGMGKSLRHRVIAEGVETPEQLAFLQAQHCGEGQGYYFSRPLVAEQFAKILEAGRTHDSSDQRTPRIWRAASVA